MKRTLSTAAARQTRAAGRDERSGTATVEFAVLAPVFLALLLGIVEMSRALDVSNNLTAAIREGGRVASMDINKVKSSGTSSNNKVLTDIRNMLTASGLPADQVTLSITHADGTQSGQSFDLDNNDNYMQNFRIAASVPYSQVGFLAGRTMQSQTIRASVVFRLGRSTLTDTAN